LQSVWVFGRGVLPAGESMKHSAFRVYAAIAIAAAAAACSDNNSSPSQPSSSLTASVAAPRAVSPGSDIVIKNGDQPVTLVVQNAASTQSAATTYTFEVATDSGFASKVQSKDGVAQGSGGQTAVKLDALTPGRDYYWHARASAGGTTGLFGSTSKFSIGPAVSLDPPVPVGPLSGTVSAGWPAFTVQNSSRSGAVGPVTYRFEISTSANFTPITVSGTVAEGSGGRTSFVPTTNQPAAQTTLFWRAFAIDQLNSVTSPSSTAISFVYGKPTIQAELAAQQGLALWPATQPPANLTNGHAILGANWDVASIVSFDGVRHTKPTIEQLRVFDLIDRGMDPQSALNWMNSNGYGTVAVYYPSVAVIGFPFEYMALIGGQWELVIRVGA
jgi:hypothetical protein